MDMLPYYLWEDNLQSVKEAVSLDTSPLHGIMVTVVDDSRYVVER
jgi:hypothetical protein